MSKNISIFEKNVADFSAYAYDKISEVAKLAKPETTKETTADSGSDKAKERVTKILASVSDPNGANQPFGVGKTTHHAEAAWKKFWTVDIEAAGGKIAGETAVLEARARTYATK